MRLKNDLTGEVVELPENDGVRWARSTTPWYPIGLDGKPAWFSILLPESEEIAQINMEKLNQSLKHGWTCIRSIVYARKLGELNAGFNPKNHVWLQLKNSAYTVAVIEWCKIFGTDSEETHWKKALGTDSGFCQFLFRQPRLSHGLFNQFRTEMMAARTKRMAHTDIDFEDVVSLPDLDNAISSLKALHAFVKLITPKVEQARKILFPVAVLDFDSLVENLIQDADETLSVAVRATQEIEAHQ